MNTLRSGGTHSLQDISMSWRLSKATELTKRLRCSMKTCMLTSSVKIACPFPGPPVAPYALLPDMCVVDGFSLDSKKRACEPPWSHTT